MDHGGTASPGGARPVPTRLDEVVLAGGTLGYGIVLQRFVPERWHLAANAAAALTSLAFARRAGASPADCGLTGGAVGRALGAGAAAAGLVAATVVIASLPRRARTLFSEERVTGHGGGRAVYEVLVRIPLGTALSEEVLFRGAMLGVMLRRHAAPAAVARASLVFGVWHVLPTLASLRSTGLGREVTGRAGAAPAIAGVIAVTAAAGAGFAALRLRSGSVLAPVLAHAALNATGYLVARRAAR